MNATPFVGYPGRVWAVCWQSLAWLTAQLSATPAPAVLDVPVMTVFLTLRNALAALSAWQTGAMLGVAAQNLISVELLPLTLDPPIQTVLTARAAATSAAATSVSALPPVISLYDIASKLASGQPAVADPHFLEWCLSFNAELPPTGTYLPNGASIISDAWLTIVQTISVLQGNQPTQAYDTATRQYRCAAVIANTLMNLQSGGFPSAVQVQETDDQGNLLTDDLGNPIYFSNASVSASDWNSTVALPTILLDAGTLAASPTSLAAQQIGIIRYALSQQMIKLSLLLLSFRSQNVTVPVTAVLRNTESLMDLAARTSGNFEDWASIAALNSLQPPYPGATNQSQALSGEPLFIAGTNLTEQSLTRQATYAANVLGTDFDFGPINGVQPPWRSDIALITGIPNFVRAIGRRLQTPLGALIYHTNYGCSIPPEVGNIQSADEAARLAAYGRAAINGDPRTGTILKTTASIESGFQAHFSATIAPIGPKATAVSVNEVIGARL